MATKAAIVILGVSGLAVFAQSRYIKYIKRKNAVAQAEQITAAEEEKQRIIRIGKFTAYLSGVTGLVVGFMLSNTLNKYSTPKSAVAIPPK